MSAGPFAPVPTANSAATTSLDATTQRSQVRSGGGGGGWWKVRTKAAPYLFLLPYLLVTAVFFLYPLCYATGLAFYQTSGPKAKTFVGFENFNFVLHDPDFHDALWNTTVFAFFSIVLQLPLSLGLAMLLNARNDRTKTFFRLAIFAPNLVGQVFVAILFQMLFTPRYGLFNRFIQALIGWGLEQRWLQDPRLVMPALIIAALWMYVGFNMIYFLAALQAVDRELYEAAQVDGANGWQQFLAVTLPGIRPVAIFVLIASTIGSFQLFELPYIMLNNSAGPNKSGLTLVMYLYNTGFVTGDLGYASAVGWTLALGVLLISLGQMRLTGAWKGSGE